MPEAFQTAAATRLRGISLRQIRLGRRLVLLSYLISHFLNHALGNISIIAMGAGVASHAEFWQWPPIAVVFYGAAATHAGLGIWALFERRQFHHRAIEPLQLILGLSIPVLIVGPVVGMRLGYFGLLGLALLGRAVRSGVERRVGIISLSYGHDRIVRVPVGLSVLEASLRHRVPHASVRGGRARCSTCRIRIIGNTGALPAASARETYVPGRIGVGTDPSIRLACQLRPTADLSFVQLLTPHAMSANAHASGPSRIGSHIGDLNLALQHDLPDPLRFGIGIHSGEVIIGDIGYRDHLVFTALGDAVNVAARLQDMTKDLACEVIVSEDVCRTAGLVADQFPARQVTIRGRLEPMTVRAVADARMLSPLGAGTQL
ncbi:adenylate/guanylate cyclase domain-containing protein [Tardiphaga sp.]|uniref:adenylate/guanylate cyclase domain-containing protein n=1 Tax=Tardiphaga sp. TaxID=1926292 RepID=UPI0025F60C91|nr:adenylate/guanylate cyclase domain-containing protein [Tardiphaga sp.]